MDMHSGVEFSWWHCSEHLCLALASLLACVLTILFLEVMLARIHPVGMVLAHSWLCFPGGYMLLAGPKQ